MGGRSDDHYYHAIDRAGHASDRHDGPDASGANARYTVDHAAPTSFADTIPTCALCIANGLATGAAQVVAHCIAARDERLRTHGRIVLVWDAHGDGCWRKHYLSASH